MIAQHYKTKDLRRIIRLRKKKNYKKLFAERNIDEITRLIKLTNQNVPPEIMQKKLEVYTHQNCKMITKFAPHMENYFEQGY